MVSTLIDDATLNQVQNFYNDKFDNIKTINYSSIEQNTGIKWIDGKDIYQITIGDGTTNLVGDNDVSALNIDQLVGVEGIGSDYAANGYPRWVLSTVYSNDNGSVFMTNANTLRCTGRFYHWYITLRYTKNI